MFSLIISIIAIALVAALALASIYYGGTAFQEGSSDAEAATVINQGQQIQGAVTLADVDEVWTNTSTQANLAPNYLKEIPSIRSKSWTIAAAATQAEILLKDGSNYTLTDVCAAIEAEAGRDATLEKETEYKTGAKAHKTQFGCFNHTTNGPTAYYKL